MTLSKLFPRVVIPIALLGLLGLAATISRAQVIEFDDTCDLPADTRFDPGLWWYWGNWTCDADPAPAEHDGSGFLVMRDDSQGWNNPALSTAGGAFYPIRDDIGVEYQIDFHLIVPEPGIFYAGLASWVNNERSRGFLIRDDGAIAVTTTEFGEGLTGALTSTRGIDTNVVYTPGLPIILRMTLKTDGGLQWEYDQGNGFEIVVPQSTAENPVTAGDLAKVTGWPAGLGGAEIGAGFLVSHYLKINANHQGSASGPPTVLIEDDFNDPAGEMSPQGVGENINPAWRWNETAGLAKNHYDGTSQLIMPMDGSWAQYIDVDHEPTNSNHDYAFVIIFTMPDSGGEGMGFTRDGSMTPGGPTRIFKLRNGRIYFSDDMWTTTRDLDTGQDYRSGTPQGLMIFARHESGEIRLFYQDGDDPDPASTAWSEITPSSDPEGFLLFQYGPNKIGVNTFLAGSGMFMNDRITLIKNARIKPEEPIDPDESILKIDRVTVTTSAPSGAEFRNGLRSGPVFLPATVSPPVSSPPLPGDFPWGSIVFNDDFDGAAGSDPDLHWRYLENNGVYLHDGNGHLVGTKATTGAQWNSPAIESRSSLPFLIPGDGTKDYLIEFRITVPEHQAHWLGIGSSIDLMNYRGFVLQGAGMITNGVGCGRICLMLNQDPGFQAGWGLETDALYAVGQPIGFLIWMRGDGSLAWYYDDGQGYQPLTATGANASWDNIPMALSWPKGVGDQFFIKVDCNGWGSTTEPNLLIDRVTVYEAEPRNSVVLWLKYAQSTPGGNLNRYPRSMIGNSTWIVSPTLTYPSIIF